MSVPMEESYWVVPGLFLAGEYPAGYDELMTRSRLQSLIRAGCLVFINLTHPNDGMPDYRSLLEDEANGYLKKVTVHQAPISDRSIPSSEQMSEILDKIDFHINCGQPVYLHCIAGIGRTGTVVGCYLVRHGIQPSDVLEKIKELRVSVPSHWARSPESDAQVDFILGWKPCN